MPLPEGPVSRPSKSCPAPDVPAEPGDGGQICGIVPARGHDKLNQEVPMQKISACLWFDNQAEEAAEFYVSVFDNSRIVEVSRYGEPGPGAEGSVLTVAFQLEGQDFLALNGGPVFQFSEAISFVIDCRSQEEVDYFWEKLSEGGETGQCGWLKDRFGVSWQVVPAALGEMMSDPDPEKARRVTEAMLQMTKLDVPTLKLAYEGQVSPQ
jgi:predicted 3-demethylubiquinone-9 3-methyltransferase (glyoxalase superfamily)